MTSGVKGSTIQFVVSGEGRRIEEVIFRGYWRCGGKLEITTLGPDRSFEIVDGKASGVSVEPEDGGSTAFRFEFEAEIDESHATGTFRVNLNALSCDTHVMAWKAGPAEHEAN